MTRPHNFKEIPLSETKEGDRIFRDLHCAGCDSAVRYDVRVSVHEINKRVSNSDFPCKDLEQYKN
jgi:hypothetical protein